jgi:mono/diheme cytochrome c family protein
MLIFTAALIAVLGVLTALDSGRLSAAGPAGLSEEFLLDERQIVFGRNVFLARCTYCHAKRGIGKAPQLRPSAREADFIFDRITNGYQGMPNWSLTLREDERRALVAYIRSDPDKY